MKLNDESGAGMSIQASLKQAEAYAKHGQHAEAIKVYKQILAGDSKNEDALVGKITSLRSRYEFAESEAETRQALELFPQNARFLNQDAELDFAKHQYEQAIKKFEQILKDYPKNDEAWAGKIKSLRSQYRFDAAEEAIRNGLEQIPCSVKIRDEKVYLLGKDRHQYDETIKVAIEILDIDSDSENAWEGKIGSLRSLKHFPEAELVIQEALKQLPQNVKILNEQGSLHADQQQYEAALKAFKEVLSIDPINVDAFDGKIKALRLLGNRDAANQALEEMCDRPGNSPEMLNQCGWFYFEQKQYDKAIQTFEQILRDVPNDEDAWERKIASLRWQSDFDKAAQAIQEALTRLPQNVKILKQQGYLYADQQQYEAALKAFEQGLSIDSINVDAFAGKIQALRSQGKRDEANQAIQEMCDRPGNSPEMLNQCGWFYFEQKQYDKAIQTFEQILRDVPNDEDAWEIKIASLRWQSDFDKAAQAIQEALTRLPQNVKILNQQGYLYAGQQHHEAALKVFVQILSIDPINVDAFDGKIKALRSQGKWDEVNKALKEMCDRPGNSPEMLNRCGRLYFKQQQYDKAIQTFEQILRDVPNDEEAWEGKIASLRSLKHFPEAELVIQEALKQLPQNVKILNQQGYLYAGQQHHEAALKVFVQILSIDPINVDAFAGKIQALRLLGNRDAANQAIQEMCDRPGNSPEMLNQCGWLYFNQQQYDKAIQTFEQILRDVPNDGEAWVGKIFSLRQQTDFDKAAQAIQEALTRLPQNVKILNQQGSLHADQQYHEAALKVFVQILSIDPINVDAFDGKIKALRSQGKWDEVNKALKEMCDRPGNSPEMLNQCGLLYFNQQQYDKAIQALEQTLKNFPNDEEAWEGKIASLRWQSDFDKAEQAIQEALTRLPQNVRILNQQGYLYADQQQYEKAIQIFDKILNDLSDNEYTWKIKIRYLELMYRFNEAEEVAQKALEQLPQNIIILKEKIRLYCIQGQYDKAIAICDEILKINPANEDAFVQKVGVLRSLKHFPEAELVIQEALKQLPQNVRILNEQGSLHADQQHHEAALKVFVQVLSIDPNNVDAFDSKIKALRSQGKWDEVNQALEEMCDRPGNSPEMLNQCGLLYSSQQQYDKAIQVYEQILKNFPNDEEAWVGKIVSLRWQSDFDKAEQAIQEAHERLPRSQRIQAQKIYLHLHQRQYDRVIKDCQEILSNNPSHEIALWGTIEALREQSHFKDACIKMKDALHKLQSSVRLLNQKGTLLLSQRLYKRAFLAFGQTLKVNPIDEDAVIGQIRTKCQDYCFDEAEKIAQDFLQQPALSRNTSILNEQGRLYLVEKKYADAIDVFVKILKLNPIDEDALAGQISCQRLQEFWGEADKLIQKALMLLPNSATLLYEQGLFYRDLDRLELADHCFEQAFRQDPTWTKLRFCQVEVKRRMRRPWDALKILEELEKSFPDDLEVKAQKGWWYLRRNQSQKAKEAFNTIDKKDKNNIEKNDGLRAIYFRQGDYKRAEAEARKVLKTEPNNPYFLANLAQILLQKIEKPRIKKPRISPIWDNDTSKRDEELDEAECLCEKALEKDCHNELVLGCLGAIAYEKGCLLETESYLLASIKEESRSGNYTSLGALYAHMGQDQKAKKNLETAIKFDEDDTQAYLELGNLYLRTDVERAIITFEKASAVDPESAEPQEALAVAYMQNSEFDKAEKILRKALHRLDKRMHQQLRLRLVQVLIGRGDKSRERGDDAVADQDYRDALREAFHLKRPPSECPEAYFFIGIIQFQFRDYKAALKSFVACLNNATEDYYFDAERNANLATIRNKNQNILREEISKIGYGLGFIFLVFLIVLWILYFWRKQGTMNETTMMLMTTLFLGVIIVAFLLPALSRLKLPGGFEAELTKPTPSVGKGPTPDSITLSQPTSPTTPKENRFPNFNTPRPKQDKYSRN